MISELTKRLMIKAIDPDASGYFSKLLGAAIEKGAEAALKEYVEAQVKLLIAKLRQLEQYRDNCQERIDVDLSYNDEPLRHAFAVACGRIAQIELDIQMIQGIGPKAAYDGWKLLPPEPTEEMLRDACAASLDTTVLMDDTEFACERACYKSFFNLAPAIPTESDDPSQSPSSS